MAAMYQQPIGDPEPLRAELRLSIHELGRHYSSLTMSQLCYRTDAVRSLAAHGGHEPARRIAQALGYALAAAGRGTPVHLYIRALDDAVDCDPADREASELLLAAVNVHLAG
jgi:hypothetical protein